MNVYNLCNVPECYMLERRNLHCTVVFTSINKLFNKLKMEAKYGVYCKPFCIDMIGLLISLHNDRDIPSPYDEWEKIRLDTK